MKKVLMICFMLVIAFIMVGCINENDKINVEFILNEISTSVEIGKEQS